MAFRTIGDRKELHILITTTMQTKTEPFTISEIVEDIFKDEKFGQFCSKEELRKKVEDIVKECLNIDLIKQYSTTHSVMGPTRFVIK